LPVATAHTAAIIRTTIRELERIFRKGYRYKKAGVMLSGLERLKSRQLSLLEPAGSRGQGRAAQASV